MNAGGLDFEWDDSKARANETKHGVPFVEAVSAFLDPLALTMPDPLHSVVEPRFLCLGMSREKRLLVVCHTERVERIRIISARETTRQERRFYERG